MKPSLNLGEWTPKEIQSIDALLTQLALSPNESELINSIRTHHQYQRKMEAIITGLSGVADMYDRINQVNRYISQNKLRPRIGWGNHN